MAVFYPDQPAEGTPKSELLVWGALESLPNSWRVFHSVGFQVRKGHKVVDGEADFVLLHPKHGFIVLEIKGGTVTVEDGNWYQESKGGNRHRLPQSPFQQASGAMYDLREYIETAVGPIKSCSRAVAFPGASHPGSMGPDAPAEQIISRDELPELTMAIKRLIEYAKLSDDLHPEKISAITSLLAPTRKLSLLLRTTIDESNRALIDLTDRQLELLRFLRHQRRALITGVAGTGKTILAIEQARHLAKGGLSVLLMCFNRPLADYMRESTDHDGVRVGSFHQLGLDMAKRAGFVPNFEPDQGWWDKELPNLLPEAAERLEERYDALVIDEGQDFKPQWFTALQFLLHDPDDGLMYVYLDENQTIYVDGWERPFEAEPFPLDTNCRNTKPIADKVARAIGVEAASLGAQGSDPIWIEAEGEAEIRVRLAEIIGGLVQKEELSPRQIVVLTDRRSTADSLRGDGFGGVRLHALGAKTGSTVETVHRFKGLEADVIILVLTELDDHRDKAIAYIGMSRARAMLIVLGPKSIKKELQWTS